MTTAIRPTPLHVPEAELDDLRRRLAGTRWPDRETVADTTQGAPLAKVRALCERWREGYDWRRCETLLNAFGPQRTEIDGLGIQFLHVRSREANALPLVLTHGWPGSILEFRHVIAPLVDPAAHGGDARDAFHVIVPSLPGFGFSDHPSETGWDIAKIAGAWIEIVKRLGYERWGAQGGDWGSAVTTEVARQEPAGLVGIHLNFVNYQPTEEERADASTEERKMLADMQNYMSRKSAYMKLQSTRPQTIGYSLSDSPSGLAAWIYTLFQDVSDSDGEPERVFALDEMIDDIMLYWLPNCGASSARLYWEVMGPNARPAAPPTVTIPTGISMFPGEQVRISRRWAERRFAKLVHFGELAHGGHFAALEAPDALVDELRATFRSLR